MTSTLLDTCVRKSSWTNLASTSVEPSFVTLVASLEDGGAGVAAEIASDAVRSCGAGARDGEAVGSAVAMADGPVVGWAEGARSLPHATATLDSRTTTPSGQPLRRMRNNLSKS